MSDHMRYLIGSSENDCVFTITNKPISAMALASGLLDSFVVGINPYTHSDLYQQKPSREFFYSQVWRTDAKNMSRLVLVDPTTVSAEWRAQQELIRARQNVFVIWESFTEAALVKSQRHLWDQFASVAQQQIALCDAAKGQFTPMIEEYARCMELLPAQALKELKLQSESDNFSRFRITAMAEKWKQKINATTTVAEVSELVPLMTREFWRNASI
jgi:hypothetical protein